VYFSTVQDKQQLQQTRFTAFIMYYVRKRFIAKVLFQAEICRIALAVNHV